MNEVEAFLDIDQVNQLTGLSQATLRNWEKRYGFPKPRRTSGGHRLYDLKEVNKIREVVSLYNQGVKAADAIRQILSTHPTENVSIQENFNSLNENLQQVLRSLYKFDYVGAEYQLSKIGMRLSETDLLEIVYPKLLIQIGLDWKNSQINVAQEHFSWNFFRTRLLNYAKLSRGNSQKPKVILTTPPGELHEGGILVLSAFMMLHGWQVYFLGPNLPIQDLQAASQSIQPQLICLSSIHSDWIRECARELDGLDPIVVIGGQCVSELKALNFQTSHKIHLLEGPLPAVLSEIEMLFHAHK